MIISKRIFDRINELEMSQKEFSIKTGIGQSTISEWKSKKTNPTAEKLLIICKVLDVSLKWLLTGENTKQEDSSFRYECFFIKKHSELGMIIEQIYNLKPAKYERLIGYLSALEQMDMYLNGNDD